MLFSAVYPMADFENIFVPDSAALDFASKLGFAYLST